MHDTNLCVGKQSCFEGHLLDPDSLPEVAVRYQPISAPNSLLTGNYAGNFADSGASLQFLRANGRQFQKLAIEFPAQLNGVLLFREWATLLTPVRREGIRVTSHRKTLYIHRAA